MASGGHIQNLPSDLSGAVQEIDTTYFASGGFSDIWRGQWIDISHSRQLKHLVIIAWQSHCSETGQLAIKAFRGSLLPAQADKFQRRLRRETRNWHLLRHPNILPLLGISYQRIGNITDYPVLISPYLRNGSIVQYIKQFPNVNRLTLLHQAAAGLEYLHNEGFVHGDLKGANILIRNDGQACLCDFGRTTIVGEDDYSRSLVVSVRWTAPELIRDAPEDSNSPIPVTFASDVWAFGMVVIEVVTGELPWGNTMKDVAIICRMALNQARPSRYDYPSIREDVWNAIEACWEEPGARPTVSEIAEELPRN